jgi:hypothetical protein
MGTAVTTPIFFSGRIRDRCPRRILHTLRVARPAGISVTIDKRLLGRPANQ